ncbi:MAG TPA: TonB-dependent siderophore receptor [Burkholderiaceae bacterium]|nr:TonB-dependent siderophore receptor [Burkholderiaceae bacterium]
MPLPALSCRRAALRRTAAAALMLGAGAPTLASAQTADASTESTQLPAVTISGRKSPAVSVSGWGDLPLSQTPLQASVYDAETLRDQGIQSVRGLIQLDAAIGDSYNAAGYWDTLTLRGFVIDNRFNYRRDGLPINAETPIPLDNKANVEVLKGISGMQAGVSSPGGLVNYTVKRPLDAPLNSAFLQWQSESSVLASVDLSRRFGETGAVGLRVNAAVETLHPDIEDANGNRWLVAAAGDWRIAPGSLLEAEFESSRQSQPSVPGFSMLGNRIPPPTDPSINLNNQPWSEPVVFGANTGSIRYTQAIAADWRWSARLMGQQLRTDDRTAFPFGCSAEGNYDRFCSDGSFDMYDYRSDDERRDSSAAELAVNGSVATGNVQHTLGFGVLATRFKSRFQRNAYNWVGVGNIDGSVVLPPDPTLNYENTNRDERSTELFVHDAMQFGERLRFWLGLRYTSLEREAVSTDGMQGTDYRQSLTSPWIAASYEFAPAQMLYASWGRGAESDVAPNLDIYTNAGQPLPALMSQQFEIGLKGATGQFTWTIAVFDIDRPVWADFGSCDAQDTCTRQADGSARHTGVEAGATWRSGAWSLGAGLQWLHARRQGSRDASVNGLRPVNVPALSFRMQAGYSVPQLPGLTLGATLSAVGDRSVLPDDEETTIPGYAVAGLTAQWVQRTAGATTLTWRAGIDNLFDKQAWKESPYQFAHVYLFPLPGRTARVSLQINW